MIWWCPIRSDPFLFTSNTRINWESSWCLIVSILCLNMSASQSLHQSWLYFPAGDDDWISSWSILHHGFFPIKRIASAPSLWTDPPLPKWEFSLLMRLLKLMRTVIMTIFRVLMRMSWCKCSSLQSNRFGHHYDDQMKEKMRDETQQTSCFRLSPNLQQFSSNPVYMTLMMTRRISKAAKLGKRAFSQDGDHHHFNDGWREMLDDDGWRWWRGMIESIHSDQRRQITIKFEIAYISILHQQVLENLYDLLEIRC